MGILANSNANAPIPKSGMKSEEKKSFYRKTVFALSESDRSRLGSLISCPTQPSTLVPPHQIVNLPKSCLESGELPSKDLLKDRISYHSMVSCLEPVSEDAIVDFLSLALEVFF